MRTMQQQGLTERSASLWRGPILLAASLALAACGDPIASVTLTPGTVNLSAIGETASLRARATTASGATESGVTFQWSSSNPAVATVSGGTVTAVANGATTVTASTMGFQASATVTVAQTGASVSVTPASPSIDALGATLQLTAAVLDARGNPVSGADVTWASDTPDVATVSASGRVTAVTNGTATIRATSGGTTGSTTVTVSQLVADIVVAPTARTLDAVGARVTLEATMTDSRGNAVTGRSPAWTSSTGSVAEVNANGRVTSTGNGEATITASADGASGSAVITVSQVVTSVALTCGSSTTLTAWGDTVQCDAEGRDRLNQPVSGSATWTSSDSDVATVDASGLVTARNNGTTTVRASRAGRSAARVVTVDFRVEFGDMVEGDIVCSGCSQRWDLTGGNASDDLLAWIHRAPINQGGVDPRFIINNAVGFLRRGVETQRLIDGAELFAEVNFPANLTTDIVARGESGSTGGYVLAVADCRQAFSEFRPGQWSWGSINSSDCAVLNGPGPNLTGAIFAPLNLNAGESVTIEVTRGCNPGAASRGCTGEALADPYLYVYSPDRAVFWNDDLAGNLNPRLSFDAPMTGIYTMVVTTFGAGDTGSFSICTFQDCASLPGAPGYQPAPARAPGAEADEWASSITVAHAYERLRRMGYLPPGFDASLLRVKP